MSYQNNSEIIYAFFPKTEDIIPRTIPGIIGWRVFLSIVKIVPMVKSQNMGAMGDSLMNVSPTFLKLEELDVFPNVGHELFLLLVKI